MGRPQLSIRMNNRGPDASAEGLALLHPAFDSLGSVIGGYASSTRRRRGDDDGFRGESL